MCHIGFQQCLEFLCSPSVTAIKSGLGSLLCVESPVQSVFQFSLYRCWWTTFWNRSWRIHLLLSFTHPMVCFRRVMCTKTLVSFAARFFSLIDQVSDFLKFLQITVGIYFWGPCGQSGTFLCLILCSWSFFYSIPASSTISSNSFAPSVTVCRTDTISCR